MTLRRLLAGLDVRPLLRVLADHPELWDQFTARQEFPGSAHHDTRCVVALGPAAVAGWFTDLEAVAWPALPALHDALRPLMREFARAVGLTEARHLGRVMLVELAPGGVVDAHVDEGAYAEYYQRFHISLSSEQGNRFYCGEEEAWMRPGELWWFDHRELHCVINASPAPRVHVIIDAHLEQDYAMGATPLGAG